MPAGGRDLFVMVGMSMVKQKVRFPSVCVCGTGGGRGVGVMTSGDCGRGEGGPGGRCKQSRSGNGGGGDTKDSVSFSRVTIGCSGEDSIRREVDTLRLISCSLRAVLSECWGRRRICFSM